MAPRTPDTFTVTVAAAAEPVLAAVSDQTWTVGTAVALNLPEATGGTAPFEYTLTGTLPAGLSFDGDARPPTISGTPNAAAAATTLTYKVEDANNASDQEQFSATVEAAALGDFSWQATMTVGDGAALLVDGGYFKHSVVGFGSLNQATFDLSGTEAEATAVAWRTDGTLQLTLTGFSVAESDLANWTLHVGDDQGTLSDASDSAPDILIDFNAPGYAYFVFSNFFSGSDPAEGAEVTVCLTRGAGTCPGGGTTEPLAWDATLTVSEGSRASGYCGSDCAGLDDGGNLDPALGSGLGGSLSDGTDNAFDMPGTSDSVAVTFLAWAPTAFVDANDHDLYLRLSPYPSPASVYEAWTINVGGVEASLSAGTLNSDNILVFTDFFTAATNPGTSGTVDVCIRNDSGTCSGGTTEPLAWDATLMVETGSVHDGYCPTDCDRYVPGGFEVSGAIGSLSDGTDNAFTIPGTSTSVAVTALMWSDFRGSTVGVGDLILRLDPLPAETVRNAWTLTVAGTSVAFSDNDGVILTDTLRFNDFFGSATPPADGTTVTVSIASGGGSGTSGTEPPASGLEARFGVHPSWHTGMPFWTELHFSAEPNIGYKDLRDKAFEVTGARITRAKRMEQGSSRSWRLLVEPDGFGDVSLTLPATEGCTAEGAVCTAEGERLETGLALAVPGPGDRLAARVKGTSSHEGESFFLKLHFSHEPNLSYRDVRDTLFAVTGGRITRAKRLAKGSNLGWRLTVEPEGVGAVGLELPATEDCSAEGAVCTRDGRRLERGIAWTVAGPPAFSVSDAEVEEAPGAVLAFEVSLSRRLRAEARVDVATVDGTATAGSDYEAVTRTLVFARGETLKTVEVTVLDDAHDEGEETMTLVLSNPEGALIDDGEGTGTIVNSDAIPKAWIARFGRTVTGQVLDAVEARLAAPREAGGRMSVAGYAVAAPGGAGGSDGTGGAQAPTQATLEDRAAVAALGSWTDGARTGRSQNRHERWNDGPEPKSLDITRHALVTGTSFTLTGGSADGGGFASLWGHASVAGFDGREDALTLDGEVTTGFLGADWAAERWTAGLALGHSAGTGGYRDGACEENAPAEGAQSGACGGRIEAELTGLYPYAGLDVTERVSVWLAGGHGAGELTVIPDGSGAIDTDLSMRMGAGGTRIAVLGSEGGEGFNLALKGDGRFTRTTSDAARGPDGGNLAEAEADVWLLRFGLEGSRRFALGGSGTGDDPGASLTPSFELALRRDGGDAETGLGADMGGGPRPRRAGTGPAFRPQGPRPGRPRGIRLPGVGRERRIGLRPPALDRAGALGVAHPGTRRRALGRHGRAARPRDPCGVRRQRRQPGALRGVEPSHGRARLRAARVRRGVHGHAQYRLRALGDRTRLALGLAPHPGEAGRFGLRGHARRDAARERRCGRRGRGSAEESLPLVGVRARARRPARPRRRGAGAAAGGPRCRDAAWPRRGVASRLRGAGERARPPARSGCHD